MWVASSDARNLQRQVLSSPRRTTTSQPCKQLTPPHHLPIDSHQRKSSRSLIPQKLNMISVRTFARSAPRALNRLATTTSRSAAFLRPSYSAVRVATASRAAFSSTPFRRAADGETDDELSAKLESEIQIEEDMNDSQQEPASVKDFLDNSPFELVDTDGQEVVKLVRNFGEEK